VLRAIGLVVVLALLPVGLSYAHALTSPGSQGWQARSVDWLRDHGLNGVVDYVESAWLAAHPPKAGGRPASVPASSGATLGSIPIPAGLHPLKGEGKWVAAGPTVGGHLSVATTWTRIDSVHTSFIVGFARIDPRAVRFDLVAGTHEPGGSGWPWGATVPVSIQSKLVAAFNSGFKMKDARGGFYEDGRVGRPLRQDAASLVVRDDGTVGIGAWGRDFHDLRGVTSVRQNLQLIVDHSKVVAHLAGNPGHRWGRVHQDLHTWRSAIGIDRHGMLIYAGGTGLDLQGIATVMQRAGAVRAMELDIHDHMVTFNLFHETPKGIVGHKLLPNMTESAQRYVQVDQRDFYAVVAR
jgi:hypothetical protein